MQNSTGSFGDYVSNKILCRQQTDRHRHTQRDTEMGDHFFRTLEVMTRRENMKVAIRPMDSIT